MYLVFTCVPGNSGGVYVPCVYLHARYLWWSLCTLCLLVCQVPLVEFMYLAFTCMPDESYHRQP